ncbi:hypothetical protein LUZ62_024320 [Rhynchospora pubera]|uniref:THUMP domain-containing protein n=1 Tax=Rhynchospora pubera TaxID=906938 RepID=A0AAV8H334_9POAL|nr:hypothetical protein LUZ62_024320 [Rhynchospora pubera]
MAKREESELCVSGDMAEEKEDEKEKREEVSGEGGEGREKAEGSEMAPWEQHAGVIILPRYDYKAPSSFLQRSHSGFLITCPIKREKSATKEAIALLEVYLNKICGNGFQNGAAKKRKLHPEVSQTASDENEETNLTSNNFDITDKSTKGSTSLFVTTSDENKKCSPDISLVKLSRSGLLLFSFHDNEFHENVVDILADIFSSLRLGKLKSPRWCHRAFPIQETCVLSEKELDRVVSKLFREYLEKGDNLSELIKFAVGYNRRGTEEREGKAERTESGLMEREHCFRVVAGTVNTIAKNVVVDLKSPEVVVMIELLPISGLPNGSPVVGVSVLPAELVSTKPRLLVKSLAADSKPSK